MKSLIVIMASLLFTSQVNDKNNGKPELTDSFSDVVKSLSEENKTLVVRFQSNPAVCNIANDHPKFAEIKAKLENAKKIDKKVKVIAIIPSMTIKEIGKS